MSTMSSWEQYQMYLPPTSCIPYDYLTPLPTPLQSPDFAALGLMSQSAPQAAEKKKNRRYKTPSPAVIRVRRTAANERERRRMNTLNVAYDMLRTALPEIDSGRRLSKYETLQMAQEYINALSDLLRDSASQQK